MANLSQALSNHDMSLLRSFPFPIHSLQFAPQHFPRSYLNLENPKLLPDFGDCFEKTTSNIGSVVNDPYSSNSTFVPVVWANSSAAKQSLSDQEENANCELEFNVAVPDFSQCMYSNDDNRVRHDEFLDTMALTNHGNDPLAATRLCTAGDSGNIIVDASCMETTSSCYTSLCGAAEIGSPPGDQFHLFSDFGAYYADRFGLQEATDGHNKCTYMIADSPLAKKHCSSNSPRKPNKPRTSPSKDPQSIAAKNRRERISERLKIIQDLVPNGPKVDLVTMLEKAISYVKFLQLQVKVLAADEFWPSQGGKAPEIGQVKEAIDAILSSHRTATK